MSEKIERLEDLTPELQQALIARYETKKSYVVAIVNDYERQLKSLELFEIYRIDHIHAMVSITPRGAELVADYQRRQMSLEDKLAQDAATNENQDAASLETLQAEIARLQAENATLMARIEQLKGIVAGK